MNYLLQNVNVIWYVFQEKKMAQNQQNCEWLEIEKECEVAKRCGKICHQGNYAVVCVYVCVYTVGVAVM